MKIRSDAWTELEDSILRENYEKTYIHNLLLPNRTTEAIKSRCNKLGLRKHRSPLKTQDFRECLKCKESKKLEDFHRNKKGSLGRANTCKKCANTIRAQAKRNPNAREKQRIYEKNKTKNSLIHRLTKNLRTRLNTAIRRKYKSGSSVRDLGCSIQEFIVYMESLFQPGMTWDNWSRLGWHIDHIKPLSSFDLTNREELLTAVHYTNLQPLWAKDNISKGNKIK